MEKLTIVIHRTVAIEVDVRIQPEEPRTWFDHGAPEECSIQGARVVETGDPVNLTTEELAQVQREIPSALAETIAAKNEVERDWHREEGIF